MACSVESAPRIATVIWAPGPDPAVVSRALGDLIARWDQLARTPDDEGVWFLARGPSRLWGGEVSMIDRVVEHLHRAGMADAAVGVGPGRLLSWVAARNASRIRSSQVIADHEADAVRERLGATVLSCPGSPAALDPELIGRLHRLGLHSLGRIMAIPIADLVGRFGEPGRWVHRWASGAEPPVGGVAVPSEVSVEIEFEDPVHQADAVLFAGRRLAEQLDQRLARRGEVATVVQIVVDTDQGVKIERQWSHIDGLKPTAVVDRLRWQLQGWNAGPVVLIRLVVVEVDDLRGRQDGWWGGEARHDDRVARAVARIAGLLGHDAVGRPVYRGGRDPVDRYLRVPVSHEQPRSSDATRSGPWRAGLPAPSPAQVLHQAVPIELFDEVGRAVQVSGRGDISAPPVRLVTADGVVRSITSWVGPWPIEERWWHPEHHRRQARLQIVTERAESLLVYLERQQWWLRALYT